MARKEFHVTLAWDGEANVWYVAETDVPGLSTWGATIDDIMAKIEGMVPELLEMNAHLIDDGEEHGLWFRRIPADTHHAA